MTRIADLRVADLMVHPVVEVQPEDTLRSVAATMGSEAVGAVVVRGRRPSGMSASRPLGIVSERDLVASIAAGADADVERAENVMTADLEVAGPEQPVLEALERMLDDEVRHIPVVRDGVVVGIVSARDVLRVLAAAAGSNASGGRVAEVGR